MPKQTWNMPVEFEGTKEERKANFDSHAWCSPDGIDYNCSVCDCKPWHKAASYPCGVEPPRTTVLLDVEEIDVNSSW